jgi:flagellar biosynthesis protein FlhA
LQVIALAPQLENILMQATQTAGAEGPGLEPGLADQLLRGVSQAAENQEQMGIPAVLLVPAPMRALMARFLRRSISQLHVLSHAEVPDGRMIRVVATVGG